MHLSAKGVPGAPSPEIKSPLEAHFGAHFRNYQWKKRSRDNLQWICWRTHCFIDFLSISEPLGKRKSRQNHWRVVQNQGFERFEKVRIFDHFGDRFWGHFESLRGPDSISTGKKRCRKIVRTTGARQSQTTVYYNLLQRPEAPWQPPLARAVLNNKQLLLNKKQQLQQKQLQLQWQFTVSCSNLSFWIHFWIHV